ncbi:uncharacterized protein FMAN_08564 [Fusarium mangiferae]|uniref:Uncharacterized protein n=1 Tax=Fusarium mangiferae TaxID=192010 RepID=A0A1L7TTE2_FUSMA|nr:uncharacterized protein FMAN_08564 [Fusarium mangiferae]CVK98597.1 uncharacterized protein FMAN_08564 [Fusarium mangiferae]
METGEPSSRGREEARLDAEPIVEQPQRISNPPERSQRAPDEIFDMWMDYLMTKDRIDDKGRAVCQMIKTNYERIQTEMPADLAGRLALDLAIFTRDSLMSDYDIPEHNPVFQKVTAKANRRKNSTELLAVTFPQWFFLAVTLGVNNPSLAPVKEFMEAHCGCEFSSNDINFDSLPAEKCHELFRDLKSFDLPGTHRADDNIEWSVDSDAETSGEDGDDSTTTSGPGSVNTFASIKNIPGSRTPPVLPTPSNELDGLPDTDVGTSGSSVTDASAATVTTTSSCIDATNLPGVSVGIMGSGNTDTSTAPDSGGLGDLGNAMAVTTEFDAELDRVISRFQDEALVLSESLARGIISSSTSSAAPSSVGAVIPSTSILPESNDNATDSSIDITTGPSTHNPTDSSAASAPDASPVGVIVSSTGNTANSSATNQPSVSPGTIIRSAINSAGPFPANTASNIRGIFLDQSSINDRIRAAQDLIDSIYQAQDTMTSLETNFQSLRQEVSDFTQAKTLEMKKVREDLHAAQIGFLCDIEALRKRQDRLKSIFDKIHTRLIDKHRERFNAIKEEISAGYEQMRRYAGEFRSDIRKVIDNHNIVLNQVKRVERSITALQNKVKYIEKIITAIQNQVKRAEESMTAIQNQATGAVASVNALSIRVSVMEQTLALVPALVRFCAQLRESLKSFSGPNQELASNNGGNKRTGEQSKHGNGKRQRTMENETE